MTEITRSIEIAAPKEVVWSYIQPQRWPEIFDFVSEVNGHAEQIEPGIGAKAMVLAGDNDAQVHYKIEVTGIKDHERITYRRFDGPLIGHGVIEIKALQTGTIFKRISHYEDVLTEQTIEALSQGMEKDNLRIKNLVESIPST